MCSNEEETESELEEGEVVVITPPSCREYSKKKKIVRKKVAFRQ
mgnify:CR=1 FL=1